jgi:hypothetical protein
MAPEDRAALVAAIAGELQALIRSRTQGGQLIFSMSTHMALAS